MEISGKHQAPAALSTGKEPFNTTVAGAQFWSGIFGEENDTLTFSNIS